MLPVGGGAAVTDFPTWQPSRGVNGCSFARVALRWRMAPEENFRPENVLHDLIKSLPLFGQKMKVLATFGKTTTH